MGVVVVDESVREVRDRGRFRVLLRYGVIGERIDLVAVEVTPLGEDPVNRTMVSKLPIGRWVRGDRRMVLTQARRMLKGGGLTKRERERLEAAMPKPRVKNGGRQERLAAAYERAFLRGEPVVAAVADELGIAESTAKRAIHDARRAGALGPAPGRKAGGLTAGRTARKGTRR